MLYYTTLDVAKELGVSQKMVWLWIKNAENRGTNASSGTPELRGERPEGSNLYYIREDVLAEFVERWDAELTQLRNR